MSLYRVVCDGIDILDYSSKDLVLLAPVLELEINTAGSLEFVMPPYHKYYDIVQIMTSTIEVYENDDIIWYGRPVEQKIDFFNQKKIYCEGPLSFFNDTVQRPEEYDNVNLYYFFDSVLQKHNDQVQKADRTFLIGNFTVDDTTVYRNLNYESTYDVLQNQCLNTNDGYFFFRRQDGINYIDWLKDMPYTCNQVIRFGLNLLNYSSNFDASEMATCVLPVGKVNSDTDKALTIADVNGGSDILVSEAAGTYGRIIKYQSWSDISDASELMQEGQKYMENTQFNSLIIECSAADLHSKNAELENFRVGQMVHCLSEPHLIDRDFPISKMSLALDSAAKIITLGIMKRKTLTRIYKNDVEQAQSYTPESYTPESYNPGVIEDENGDEWEIKLPEEDGDPITAQRIPTAIRVARMPNKTEYEAGETLVWSGLVVQAMVDDKIWTNPPKYISGQIPLGELTFSTKKAPKNISEFSVDIMWTYKEKRYHTTVKLNVKEDTSGKDVYVFASGNRITITSAKISNPVEYVATNGTGPFYVFGVRFDYINDSSHQHITGGYIVSKNPFASASVRSYTYKGETYTAYTLGQLPYQEAFDPVTVNAPLNTIRTQDTATALTEVLPRIAIAITHFNGVIDKE